MPHMELKKLIHRQIKRAVNNVYHIDFDGFVVEHPENLVFGDYATNTALLLAKELKQNPMEIAKKLSYELSILDTHDMLNGKKVKMFDLIETAQPGFINFKISLEWLNSLLKIDLTNTKYYKSIQKRTVLIEFSQPNPNHAMHVGHARNNFLGMSLANIHEFLGYKIIKANYMNDWGTHICKPMLIYKKFYRDKIPDKKPDHFVSDLYVQYEREEENNPDIKNELAEMFQKLESGDTDTMILWKKITGWVYDGWKKTYEDQGVEFDVWFYQSNYQKSGKEVVQKAIERGIAEKDITGAVIARLEKYNIPDKVLLRSDGTSVYATQDLQLAADGYQKYKYDKRLYVVDYRQSDYFKQIFKIAEILGYEWAEKLYHVSYGTVGMPEGKMSSRKGLVVKSDDVLDEVVKAERVQVENSIKNIKDPENTIHRVGMAAFKYGMLKVDPKQDIVFDINEVTRFEGNTGPYILYTYARCNSVLDKAKFSEKTVNYDVSDKHTPASKEDAILRHLYQFYETAEEAGHKLTPHVVANYAFNLSQLFNTFYNECPINNAEDDDVRKYRLILTYRTSQIIKKCMHLLGIKVVDRM